jgi:hypothetical protein
MKQWFEFYSASNIEIEKIQQLVGQIPKNKIISKI